MKRVWAVSSGQCVVAIFEDEQEATAFAKGRGQRVEARGTDKRKVDKAFTDRIMQAKANV